MYGWRYEDRDGCCNCCGCLVLLVVLVVGPALLSAVSGVR
jgi:hypothetical protein